MGYKLEDFQKALSQRSVRATGVQRRTATSDESVPVDPSSSLRVLGIDPGSRFTGWGIVERRGARLVHVDNGVIVLRPKDPLELRLVEIHARLLEVIDRYEPEVGALERIFFSRNAQSALVLGHARGVALHAVAAAHLPVHEYTAGEVKRAVSTSGRAAKEQVQQMVRILLDLPEVPQEDAADALAVAICHCGRAGALSRRKP